MAGGGCKGTSGICASGISHDHPRRDSTRRGKQERRTRKEVGWNQDWTEDGTGWRKKKDLLGGSDRWMRENLYDLRG